MAAAVSVIVTNAEGKFLNKAGKWTKAENQAQKFASRAQASTQIKTLGLKGTKMSPAPQAKAKPAKSTKKKAAMA
jgi:hypothetical protein